MIPRAASKAPPILNWVCVKTIESPQKKTRSKQGGFPFGFFEMGGFPFHLPLSPGTFGSPQKFSSDLRGLWAAR